MNFVLITNLMRHNSIAGDFGRHINRHDHPDLANKENNDPDNTGGPLKMPSSVPERMVRFIKRRHVMTAATSSGNGPWCAILFYSYIPEKNIFVFTSETGTRHSSEMLSEGSMAASVTSGTAKVRRLRGLQLTGSVRLAAAEEAYVRSSFLKKFPFAVAAELTLWVFEPVFMKMTDNRLGFGEKIYWQKHDGQ